MENTKKEGLELTDADGEIVLEIRIRLPKKKPNSQSVSNECDLTKSSDNINSEKSIHYTKQGNSQINHGSNSPGQCMKCFSNVSYSNCFLCSENKCNNCTSTLDKTLCTNCETYLHNPFKTQ